MDDVPILRVAIPVLLKEWLPAKGIEFSDCLKNCFLRRQAAPVESLSATLHRHPELVVVKPADLDQIPLLETML